MRSVLLYGSEVWALSQTAEKCLMHLRKRSKEISYYTFPCNYTILTEKSNQLVAQYSFYLYLDPLLASARFIGHIQGTICSDVSI